MGGQGRFTVFNSGEKPQNRSESKGKQSKERSGAHGQARWGRVGAFHCRESGGGIET